MIIGHFFNINELQRGEECKLDERLFKYIVNLTNVDAYCLICRFSPTFNVCMVKYIVF